jgi:hypothetical protein
MDVALPEINQQGSQQLDTGTEGFRKERFAAAYLGVSVETLRTWRRENRGPRFRKIGGRCVRYSLRDLISFAEASPAGGGLVA